MLSMNSYSFIIFRPFEMVASKRSSGNALFSITHDLRPNLEDALEINANTCFDSCVTFQRRIMQTTEEADERFYRDTENIAFPALSDEQLATLESLGTRHKVNRGEIVYKAGQRDVPFHLVLSGEVEVFESCDANVCSAIANLPACASLPIVIRAKDINSTIFSIRTIIHTESSTQRASRGKHSRNE